MDLSSDRLLNNNNIPLERKVHLEMSEKWRARARAHTHTHTHIYIYVTFVVDTSVFPRQYTSRTFHTHFCTYSTTDITQSYELTPSLNKHKNTNTQSRYFVQTQVRQCTLALYPRHPCVEGRTVAEHVRLSVLPVIFVKRSFQGSNP